MDTILSDAAPAPSKAPDVTLEPRMHAAEALHLVVSGALQHLRANEAPAAAGDVEGVHQLRVAVRRLRTALVLFEKLLEPHAVIRFETELRRLGRLFGQARDWDVFCTETLEQADLGGMEAKAALRRAAAPAREAAHAALRAELAAPLLHRLLEGIADWVDPLRTEAGAVGELRWQRRLDRVSPALLERLERKVDRRGRHLRRATPEGLHALRKSLKKLRYGAEFLESIHGRKAARSFRHGCRDLQDLLGRINDAAASVRLAAILDAGDRPDLAPAVGALAKWAERRTKNARHGLPRAWAAFRAAKRPWH